MNLNMPYLMVISKNPEAIGLSNNCIILDKPIISIGRKNNNDIVIKSKALSGHHADIIITNKNNKTVFLLKDNQSTNKTFVNDIPIKEYILNNKDLIRLGDIEFVFNNENDLDRFSPSTVMLNLDSNNNCDMNKTKNLYPLFDIKKQKDEKLRFLFLTLLIFLGLTILLIIIFFFSILTHISLI